MIISVILSPTIWLISTVAIIGLDYYRFRRHYQCIGSVTDDQINDRMNGRMNGWMNDQMADNAEQLSDNERVRIREIKTSYGSQSLA